MRHRWIISDAIDRAEIMQRDPKESYYGCYYESTALQAVETGEIVTAERAALEFMGRIPCEWDCWVGVTSDADLCVPCWARKIIGD